MEENEYEILETDIGTFTENKILGLSAQEVYEKELKRREQIDICPTPTIEEQLLATQKMLLSLQEQIIDMA